jgi:hypothetical protein
MAEFIENPRRAPRAPVRCDARVALREGGFWSSPTSDYGPKGCQLLAPVPLAPGTRVFVELANERIERPVEIAGRVAWIAKAPPWRMGLAFDAGSLRAAGGFFEELAAVYPGIDTYGRAPDRIPAGAPLAPAAPPGAVPELTAEEARVIRGLGTGLRVAELRDKLAGDPHAALNAIFSLLGRKYVVVGEPDAAAAAAWASLSVRM